MASKSSLQLMDPFFWADFHTRFGCIWGKVKSKWRKGEGKEKGKCLPFVFGHRGERKRICFSLVLFVDRRKGKAYLISFFDLYSLIRKLLTFSPFWTVLDRLKSFSLNVIFLELPYLICMILGLSAISNEVTL